MRDNSLDLEKLKIDERLKKIENYIIEGKLVRIQITELLKVHAAKFVSLEEAIDGKGDTPGIRDRVLKLEEVEKERVKTKDGFLKIAIGSITLAVGTFVLWLFKLLWHAAGK